LAAQWHPRLRVRGCVGDCVAQVSVFVQVFLAWP